MSWRQTLARALWDFAGSHFLSSSTHEVGTNVNTPPTPALPPKGLDSALRAAAGRGLWGPLPSTPASTEAELSSHQQTPSWGPAFSHLHRSYLQARVKRGQAGNEASNATFKCEASGGGQGGQAASSSHRLRVFRDGGRWNLPQQLTAWVLTRGPW